MEAPNSSYTGFNLHNREHLFSLAPPCHPSFSGCNQMEATTSCVQEPTWTSEDNSPPEHLPTSLEYKIMNTLTIYADKSLLTILFCSVNLIFNNLFCTSFLPQQVCSASHSSVILLFFCSVCHVALLLFSFCIAPSHLAIPLLLFFFLLFTHFSFRTINPIRSHSFSFIRPVMTVPLPLPMRNPTTSVLATETLTNSSFSVGFT